MRRPSFLFIVVFLSGFVLDQVIKLVISYWFPQLVVGNLSGVLGIVPAAWSMIGLGGILVWIGASNSWSLGAALILAGGISNLFDRILWGQVIDYLNFFKLTVFNLADVLLMIGAVLVAYGELFKVKE